MEAGEVAADDDVTEDDRWVPLVGFPDREDSMLVGTVSFPLASFLTADEALRLVESTDRLIDWATAVKLRALARVEEAIGEDPPRRQAGQPVRFGGGEAHALAVTEVSTACAVSEGTAARSLSDAADCAASQWAVLEALEDGGISAAHARIILDQARSLPAGQAGTFSRLALRRTRTRQGRRRTPAELRACLRRLRESLHPESFAARKEAARRERGVWMSPEPDGMCTLTALLDAEIGTAIFNGIDCDARQAGAKAAGPSAGPDPCTLSELRAEALAHRLLGGTDESDAGAFRAEVIVTIPVGLVLNGSADGAEAPLAELEGYGPLDASTARRLAALAPTWHRLFTDCTTGHAVGVGRGAYRPPKALRRYLKCRDGTCRFPGCTRPASGCEPDHTIEWQDGGTTDAGNLAMLCRRHHALKSIGAWTYRQASSAGDLEWLSPLGRDYSTGPAEFGKATDPHKPDEPPPF